MYLRLRAAILIKHVRLNMPPASHPLVAHVTVDLIGIGYIPIELINNLLRVAILLEPSLLLLVVFLVLDGPNILRNLRLDPRDHHGRHGLVPMDIVHDILIIEIPLHFRHHGHLLPVLLLRELLVQQLPVIKLLEVLLLDL